MQRIVATNCFLEPGWRVKDTDGQTIKELAGKGPACLPRIVFSVRFFRCLSKDVVTTNLPKRLIPLTSFESLWVPAFPPNAISSSTTLVVLRGVLEAAAAADRVIACELPVKSSLEYYLLATHVVCIGSRIASFSSIRDTAMAEVRSSRRYVEDVRGISVERRCSSGARLAENGVTYSLPGRESNVVEEECEYRLAGWGIVTGQCPKPILDSCNWTRSFASAW